MTVLLVFLGATAAGFLGALARHRSLSTAGPGALRTGLAVMFLVTGTTHFVVLRDDLVAMVPPALPAPELLVTVTGVLELAGAVGLLLPPTTAWAAGGLALLLVAMFPANVHAAASGATLAGAPATALGPRAAMQLLYLAAAVTVALAYRDRAVRPSAVVGATVSPPRASGPAAGAAVGVVLVTRLQLRSARQVPGLLLASLRLRRALRRSPGAVWLELAVQPLTRTFWTWSAWTDETALRRYTRSTLHTAVMRSYGPSLAGSQVRALAPGEAPRSWPEARRRVEEREHVRR